MALTHKKISIKNIIAKVYQDLNLPQETDIGSLMEWSAEALGKINVYEQLSEVPCEYLEIVNYKAEIPCNLVYLDYVSYGGKQLSKASGNLPQGSGSGDSWQVPPLLNNRSIMGSPTYEFGRLYSIAGTEATFKLENGYFKTSVPSGTLTIGYRALTMDEEGFPLIPDDESFRDAIFWYIAHKYFYIKAIQEDRFRWFYQDADAKYRYYVNQAGANAMMPDIFTLENIKRNYLQLLPKVDSFRNFFSDLNQPSNSIHTNAK